MSHISQQIHIHSDGVTLHGSLRLHHAQDRLVVFVQGIGSGRFSARNKLIVSGLAKAGISSLLIDLLTPGERTIVRQRNQQSNIDWLYARLMPVIEWIKENNDTSESPVGLFGSNLGAAAAMKMAAEKPQYISALVSWSGRPDLVIESLPAIKAPTLLIAGSHDATIVNANRKAAEQLLAKCYLEILPDTGLELKDSEKLDDLAKLSCNWFELHLPQQNQPG